MLRHTKKKNKKKNPSSAIVLENNKYYLFFPKSIFSSMVISPNNNKQRRGKQSIRREPTTMRATGNHFRKPLTRKVVEEAFAALCSQLVAAYTCIAFQGSYSIFYDPHDNAMGSYHNLHFQMKKQRSEVKGCPRMCQTRD